MLKRAGQTEASVDLAAIAGMTPAAVICEIMNEDGTMARMPDLREFAVQHGLKIISVADIIKYRMQNEKHVHCLASPRMPTAVRRVPRARRTRATSPARSTSRW